MVDAAQWDIDHDVIAAATAATGTDIMRQFIACTTTWLNVTTYRRSCHVRWLSGYSNQSAACDSRWSFVPMQPAGLPTRSRSSCQRQPTSPSKRFTSTVSQKNSLWGFLTFFPNGWEFLVQILHVYYTFLSTLKTKIFLFISPTLTKLGYAILSATTQRADGGHFEHMMWTGWSRLSWHNFVKVAGNWIKICSLASGVKRNVKYACEIGLKIPNRLGGNVRKPRVIFWPTL